MKPLKTYLKINPADSVVVCLEAKQKGDIICLLYTSPSPRDS